MTKGLRPTKRGSDVKGNGVDGHVRLEDGEVVVDLFDSSVKDPNESYLESESFPATREGAARATQYLKDNGINHRIVV